MIDPVQTFLAEAEDLIADIEQSALSLASEVSPEETVNRLFRAFHTIKGSGGMCGLDAVAAFTHHVESLLERVRARKIGVSQPLAELILKTTDHIKRLLNVAAGGELAPEDAGHALIAAIAQFGDTSGPATNPGHPQPQIEGKPAKPERKWSIRLHPNPALLANGGNPAALFRDLRKLGPCEVTAHAGAVPPLDEIQTDRCYFWWSITLHAACDENAIRDVFLFVEDDGRLEIQPAEDVPRERRTAIPLDEDPRPAEARPSATPLRMAPKAATVRVPAERLDLLVRLVGEFVMNQSCLAQAAAQSGAPELANPVQVLERLVAELRDNVLGIRMLPIGTLFGRFRRVVHDLSAELGKEVDLITGGAETELDKSILDLLGEPMVHCLRNCLDHGVEPAAERVKSGKPPRSTIRLSASHEGSSVVIAIEDDGRGIDRNAVRAKAIEKGLAAPDANLSDKEILDLILLPGFSTARQVTSVSGRGVGMDAVKRQIDALRGRLSLESRGGIGTRVSITLPLTLAIIEGLLVRIGGDRFILPMAAVTENVELHGAERARNNGRNVLAVRGELVPYIDLRKMFQVGGCTPSIEKVVIVKHGEERVGLVVDHVVGTHQTVIQSLGRFYHGVDVVSGATIMGDGQVALILDVARLVHFADGSRGQIAEVNHSLGIASQAWRGTQETN